MTAQEEKGLKWALAAAVISGVAVFANTLVVKGIDPLVHTTVKNSVAGLLVLLLLLLTGEWRKGFKLNRRQWSRLGGIAIIGGSVAFAMFFTGLKQIGAAEGQLLNKTLVIWVALMAVPLLKEKVSGKMAAAIVLLYGSSLLAGGWKSNTLSTGHFLVMGATLLWAVESVLVKKTLTDVPVNLAVAARMTIGSIILLLMLVLSGKAELVANLNVRQWVSLAGVGVLLFGYVMSWYRALKFLPATLVASVLVGAVVVTTMLEVVLLDKAMTTVAVVQAGMVIGGVYLVINGFRRLAASGEMATRFWKPKIS